MTVKILIGDCRERLTDLPDASVQCCVTSPPYFGLRDYGADGQIGLEPTPEEFVDAMVAVFREVRRVLRDDGTLWLNLGDSYANDGKFGGATGGKHSKWLHGGETRIGREKRRTGLKPKDLIGVPWRVAFALQSDGWYLRSDIIWHKPNPMPESINDRPTSAHEHVFLLTKSDRYFYDADAIRENAEGAEDAGKGKSRYNFKRSGSKRGVPLTPDANCGTHRSDRMATDVAPTRNARNVWTIATRPFAEAHFATFPPDLAEICIKAGSSARGCCASCGSPWGRVRGEPVPVEGRGAGNGFVRPERLTMGGRGVEEAWTPTDRPTVGWRPSCSCAEAEPMPCAVLDPFGGAGTTGLVADRLGRNAMLIELNPEYAAMAERRIRRDAGLFAQTEAA
ncbi:DNA modification methylase [Azospirillum agricola]|uniref:DNA-methyltransferase n=1 Tax=Azospirillum agricola TaxID=1720247 RepID=UPI001AE1F7DC|nr:site-specific DNA-methyltransferase [Azospirillum agricola]MBP2232515.1 DNA modification methylase [Azospirillum agricola]